MIFEQNMWRSARGVAGVVSVLAGLVLSVPARAQLPPSSVPPSRLAGNSAPSRPGDIPLKALTEVVNVPVVVRDRDQHLISDLKRDDFSLKEDGRQQEIRYFSRTLDVPLTLAVVVDTTVCQDEGLPLEKDLAQDFIQQIMKPGDQGFVMHFGSNAEFLQHLTSDVAKLTAAIDKLQIEPHPHSWERPRSKFDRGSHHLYDGILAATNELTRSPAGRKVILLITDGFEQGSLTSQKTALDAAERTGAMIYCINMVDAILGQIPGVGNAGRPLLTKLTGDTGGRLFWVEQPRDLPGAFNDLAEELRLQYFIGYTPSNSRHDGSFRKIQVTVADKTLVVRARPGYYAPAN